MELMVTIFALTKKEAIQQGSQYQKKKKKKELKERERFLIMLFEHLDPAVLETRNGKF